MIEWFELEETLKLQEFWVPSHGTRYVVLYIVYIYICMYTLCNTYISVYILSFLYNTRKYFYFCIKP